MSKEDEFRKKEILQKMNSAPEKESKNTESRRSVMKILASSIASIPLLGALTGQSRAARSDKPNIRHLEVTRETAQQQVESISSKLLHALYADGHIDKPNKTSFPYHQMDDESQLGGIEKVQIDGGSENVIIHKPTDDGGRLSLLIPGDNKPAIAEYYPIDGKKVIAYNAMGDRGIQERRKGVGIQATCDGTSCVDEAVHCPCNSLDCNAPNDKIFLAECPNCWIPGDCIIARYECNSC